MTPQIDLVAARRDRGLSIREAARQIGVSHNTLLRAERGDHLPQPRHAFKIASFYGHKVTDVWPVEPVGGEAA